MKNTLIWVTNSETLTHIGLEKHGHKFHIFISDTDNTEFRYVAKEMKKTNTDRILKINNDLSFEIILKKNSVWSSIKFNDLVSNWMIYNNISPMKGNHLIPELLNNKKQSDITFPFEINKDNPTQYLEVLLFYLEDGSIKNTIEYNNRSYSTINSKIKLDSIENFEDFKKLILTSKPRGLSFEVSKELEDGTIQLQTKYVNI